MLIESPEWQNTVIRVGFGIMVIIVTIWFWSLETIDYLKEKKEKEKNMDGGKNE